MNSCDTLHVYIFTAESDQSNLLSKVNKSRTTFDLLRGITNSHKASAQPPPSWHSPYNWTSVPPATIGSSNLQVAATFSYAIPKTIPSTATEVLVYVKMYSGTSSRGTSNDVKIYTQIGKHQYEKYIFDVSWNQDAFNTNSDNMWFPMPPNRLIYLTVPTALGDHAEVQLIAIGYR